MERQDKEQHTDIAALSAAIVAVFVTLFVSPGLYGIINVVIGITLDLIIIAYVFRQNRDRLQMLAVAAALSFATMPIYGFLWEVCFIGEPKKDIGDPKNGQVLRPKQLDFIVHPDTYWDCKKDKETGEYPWDCTNEGKPNSRVPDWLLAASWIVFAGVFGGADYINQKRRKERSSLLRYDDLKFGHTLDVRVSGSVTLNEPRR